MIRKIRVDIPPIFIEVDCDPDPDFHGDAQYAMNVATERVKDDWHDLYYDLEPAMNFAEVVD